MAQRLTAAARPGRGAAAQGRASSAAAARLGGEQDFPSLDRFVSRALAATDDDFVRTPLPTVAAVAKKKTPSARAVREAGSGEAPASQTGIAASIRAAKLREKRARN